MKYLGLALIYLGFFGLIGFSVWYTESPYCLFALLLMPSYKSGKGDDADV